MSKQALQKTLKFIETRMQTSSQAYRDLISDKKVHSITVSQQKIKTQVKQEMLSRGGYRAGELPQSIIDIIDSEVPKMCKGMYEEFKNFNTETKRTEVTEFMGNAQRFTFTIGAKPGREVNIFNQFRKVKQVHQRTLLRKLNQQIRKLNKGRNETNQIRRIRSSFLDIGHQEGSAVSTQRKKEVEKALFDWSTNNKNPIVRKFVKQLRDETSFKITKRAGDPIDVIEVELESKYLNRQRGGGEEKALSAEITENLKRVTEAVDAFEWVNQKGSDSKSERIEKTIKNPLAETAKRNKSIRTDIKQEAVKLSKTTVSSKKKKTKVTTGAAFKDTSAAKTSTFTRQNRQSMFSIMAIINQKLPNVLEKNMNYPRLENRTGRFLRSVRLTDVAQTRQGFVSFGYTYDRDPYQVFEMGTGKAPWATNDRDPRKLIDASIREIAAEMALGRFYTRRV